MVHPKSTVIRSETVESIQRFIRAGYDVNLVSPKGNGNTEFLRTLRTELQETDYEVLLIPNIGERSELPLALANFLSDSDAPLAQESTSSLLARLERRLGNTPLVVLCDGQVTLRRVMRTLISLARERMRIHVVVCTPVPVPTLLPNSMTATVRLPLLSLDETHSVLAYRLGGSLHRDTLGRIYSKAAGLIKLSTLLADVGRLEEQLRVIDQRWIAVGDLWNDALYAEIAAYGTDLSPQQALAVQHLSFAGVTKLVDAEKAVGYDMLEFLEQRELIVIDETGANHWVTVNPPLLAERELRMVPYVRRDRYRGHLGSQRIDADGISVEPGTAAAPKLEPALLRRLSEYHTVRVREAYAAWALEPNAVNVTELIGAVQPTPENAADLLEHIRTARTAAADPEDLIYLRMWEAWIYGYVFDNTERALVALTEEPEAGIYAGVLAAAQVRMQIDLDEVPETGLALLDLDEPNLPVLVRNELHRARAYFLLISGKPNDAVAELERISSWAQDYFSYQQTSMLGMSVLYSGDATQAASIALHGYERALDELDERSVRMHGYVLGHIALARGDLEDPVSVRETIRALGDYPVVARIGHLGSLINGVLAERALTPELSDLIRDICRYSGPEGMLPGTSPSLAFAHEAYLAEDAVTAAQLTWDAAQRLQARGGRLAALDLGVISLNYHYDSARAVTLSEWQPHVDSVVLNARLESVIAAHEQSIDRLTQVIPQLLHIGLQRQARHAYAALTGLLESHDEAQLSALTKSQLHAIEAQLLGDSENGENTQLEDTLTAREYEVAQLLERGMTNREIQDELVLSIRTVENHVHRILRKLGVTSRNEATTIIRSRLAQHVR